jgi:hypothetical protein
LPAITEGDVRRLRAGLRLSDEAAAALEWAGVSDEDIARDCERVANGDADGLTAHCLNGVERCDIATAAAWREYVAAIVAVVRK